MHCLKTHILINELIVTNLRYQESNAEILAKALELLEFIETIILLIRFFLDIL